MILSKTDDFESDHFKEIAAITMLSGQNVEVKDDLGGGQVKGHIDGMGGNTFISYQWMYPSSQVKGQYQCTVHGMDKLGHPVMSTTQATVEENTVDIDSVLTRLKGCEKSKDQLQTELTATKSQLTVTETQLNSTQQELLQSNQTLERLNHRFLQHGTVHNNHVYFTSDQQPANVTLFQQQCREKGGYLVEINDENEYQFLKTYLTSLNHTDSQLYYLGMTDQGHAGRWTYITSGSDVTFTKWFGSPPGDSVNKHCAAWAPSIGLGWIEIDCVNNHAIFRYVCEVDLSAVSL